MTGLSGMNVCQEDGARPCRAAGAAGNLMEELIGALGGAQITAGET